MNECRFELSEILCVECGRPTGELGTCEDMAYCPKCKRELEEHILGSKTKAAQHVIQLIEGHKYHPKTRVLHYDAGSQSPLCGAKGGPHPLTTNLNESNCKRCIRRSVTHAA